MVKSPPSRPPRLQRATVPPSGSQAVNVVPGQSRFSWAVNLSPPPVTSGPSFTSVTVMVNERRSAWLSGSVAITVSS